MRVVVGDVIQLSTNQVGIVVDVNGGHPERPVVRLFDAKNAGSQLAPELDLAKHREVCISRIIKTGPICRRPADQWEEESGFASPGTRGKMKPNGPENGSPNTSRPRRRHPS